jgi:hypothetical protein
MDLFLTILKFGGIIVSGALGILGTVTETRNKRTGRLTRWGKWALSLTIAGFATALLAQIAEQVKGQRDSQKAQNITNLQLQRAEESLNYLERLGTRFEMLSFTITYRLTTNNSEFALVRECLSKFIADSLPGLSQAKKINSATPPHANNLYSDILSFPSPDQRLREPIGQNIVGYANPTFGTNSYHLVVSVSDSGVIQFALSNDDLLTLLSSFSTNATSHDSLSFIFSPQVYLRLIAAISPMAYEVKGDLFILATNRNRVARFEFVPASREILVQLTFDCPKATWEQTKWMSSLPDLANAVLFIGVTNTMQEAIVPVTGSFTFDVTTVTATNFLRCDLPNWYEARLPSKREILDAR